MKNQYFGDVNDYREYGLLRTLRSKGHADLLVVWMLTPDDGELEGELRSQLEYPDRWSKYYLDLFASLADLLR